MTRCAPLRALCPPRRAGIPHLAAALLLTLLGACKGEDTGEAFIDADRDGVPAGNDCDEADPDQGWPGLAYRDVDGDGYGDPYDTIRSCSPPDGYTDMGLDCDDTDASVNPETRWYQDGDLDGYGLQDTEVRECVQPEGYVRLGADCDDTNPAVSPGATETCNGVDDDCDGLADDGC